MPLKGWDVLNFITFQIWASVTVLGFIAAAWTGHGALATIAPWVGLVVGVAAEELTPGFVTEGVKIV